MHAGTHIKLDRLPQPGFWLSAVLLMVVLGLQFTLGLSLSILDSIAHRAGLPVGSLGRDPLALAILNLLVFAAAIGLGLALNRVPLTRGFPFRRITARQLLGLVLIVLGGGIALSEADNVLRWIQPSPRWIADLYDDVFGAEGRLFSRIFLLTIVAPLTEELLFRGIILRGLLSRYRPAVAVAVSAAFFALLHVNPWQFVSTFSLGAIFGWLYLRTGSLTICILAHALHNGMYMVLGAVPWDIPGFTGAPNYDQMEFQPWYLDIAGALLLGSGFWIMAWATKSDGTLELAEPPVIVPPGIALSATEPINRPPPLPELPNIRPPSGDA